MNFVLKILSGIVIWLLAIEIERTWDLVFFGSSFILTIFLTSAAIFLTSQVVSKLKTSLIYSISIKSSKYFGVLLISVFTIHLFYASFNKSNFKLTIEQIENYRNQHGILPNSLADLPNPKSNIYAFLKHDFIYESEMYMKNEKGVYEWKKNKTDKIIGYKTPLGEWRYQISPNSATYDYIFYDD